MNRTSIANKMFERSEALIRKFYPWVNDTSLSAEEKARLNTDMCNDLTSISIAHMSTYLMTLAPEMKPQLLAIVARVCDIEIEDGKLDHGVLPIESKRDSDITYNPLAEESGIEH